MHCIVAFIIASCYDLLLTTTYDIVRRKKEYRIEYHIIPIIRNKARNQSSDVHYVILKIRI